LAVTPGACKVWARAGVANPAANRDDMAPPGNASAQRRVKCDVLPQALR